MVVDTDRDKVFRLDGVRARLVYEDNWQVIYLRLGRLGWIRFGSVWEAAAVAQALQEAVDLAHKEAELREVRQ